MSKNLVLFDANASYGKSPTGTMEFPTIAARLAHLDRLGVSRALIWNVEARLNSATVSNERLLDEIERTPGAADRLVPALCVSGLMTYEPGAITALATLMRARRLRALRFANVTGRLTLCQLEPVVDALRALHPVLVLRHDETNLQDLLDFTALFPDVRVILTEVMWSPCITVFDLMRRRANVLADNSWLHSDSAIELAVRHFGADRLVFGLGHKTHQGAAIAALAGADVSAADRERIAHGNLDRLLGVKTVALPAPAAGAAAEKVLWQRCLAGQPLGVDVVDAHAHLGPSGGYVVEAHQETAQIARALSIMDRLGLATMIVSGCRALGGGPVEGNDYLEQVLAPHVGRFQGYLVFNPHFADELTPHLERWFAGRVFVGFKTLCGYWHVPINDARFQPMWAFAERHRLPILNHTWGSLDSPALLTDVVRRYRQAAFLLGHAGGSENGRREAEALAQGNSNVYLEWCGSFCNPVPWEDTLRSVKPRQVVFGTDAMLHSIHWELGRLLSLDVPDATLVPVLGQNMRRLLARRR